MPPFVVHWKKEQYEVPIGRAIPKERFQGTHLGEAIQRWNPEEITAKYKVKVLGCWDVPEACMATYWPSWPTTKFEDSQFHAHLKTKRPKSFNR